VVIGSGPTLFSRSAPSRKLLDRISDKWVTLILAALGSDGSHRFSADCAGEPRAMRYSELSRLLVGVGQKMLTQTLRSRERDGLITRSATPTVPVSVSHELTDLGLSLRQMMRGLKTWAECTWTMCSPTRDVRPPQRLNQGPKAPHSPGARSSRSRER
jgi:DNA-binding HxlR family transcriptional regulator